MESRDPYESFVINRAFFDLIEEQNHFVKKDIRRADKSNRKYVHKYNKYVSKLFSHIWKSLDQRSGKSPCENPDLVYNRRC